MKRILICWLTLLFLISSSINTSRAQSITWQHTSMPAYGPTNVLVHNREGVLFAGTDGGGVFRSTDGGGSWLQIDEGLPVPYVRSMAIDSSGVVFVGTQGAGVLRSTDLGDHWVQTPLTNVNTIRALGITQSGVLLAGTSGGGAFRSTDRGDTWQPANNGMADEYVRSFTMTSDGTVFAGTAFVGVYKSTDEGLQWEVTGLHVDWDFRALAVNAADVIFAGGWGGGVFRSEDYGGHWSPVDSGLTNMTIEGLAVDQQGLVFAATRAGGVCVSSNDGDAWSAANSGLTDPDARSLTVTPEGYVLVGTGSTGVYRTTQPTTSVNDRTEFDFVLEQNFPNPLNPETRIRFVLPIRTFASLVIYDVTGRRVARVLEGELNAGVHEVLFDASNFASGVYYYRLLIPKDAEGNARTATRRMVLVK